MLAPPHERQDREPQRAIRPTRDSFGVVRILITGGRGQLGTDVALACEAAGDDVTRLGHSELDIGDGAAVQATVASARPDAIINCAAWTAVDDCEADPERADLVNHRAVGFLAEAAQQVGAHLVQVSTDYVFDGTKLDAYIETDTPNPQSVYGTSKLAGEGAAGERATIVRTSWVCSGHGGNMVATILRLAANHPSLSFVSDQRGNPTFTADLAPALRQLALDRHEGTLHVTNEETVSWFEFARAVLEASGSDPERVSPIATAELKPARPAPRPTNSALSNQRYASAGYAPLRNFREALAEVIPAYL